MEKKPDQAPTEDKTLEETRSPSHPYHDDLERRRGFNRLFLGTDFPIHTYGNGYLDLSSREHRALMT